MSDDPTRIKGSGRSRGTILLVVLATIIVVVVLWALLFASEAPVLSPEGADATVIDSNDAEGTLGN
ncbi:hypothetical protein [uncultured Jannaschia sp.]|uniref:hypothetical protein n=1 Tax=uncultured Jannaschia sp. TaxID=293347 RepID=UPI002601E7DB|nr:hypothetical protein [uncultured Jannaschia sp.]